MESHKGNYFHWCLYRKQFPLCLFHINFGESNCVLYATKVKTVNAMMTLWVKIERMLRILTRIMH